MKPVRLIVAAALAWVAAPLAPAPAQVQLQQTQPATLGSPTTFLVQNATPGALQYLGLSFGLTDPPLPTPFGPLYLQIPANAFSMGPAGGAGTANASVAVPNLPVLRGSMVHFQALDLGTLTLSNPVTIWIGPPDAQDVLVPPQPQQNGAFGTAVAVGDFLGTPDLDIAVGAPGEMVGANNGAGRIHVFVGPTFATVVTLISTQPNASGMLGHSVVALDWNGDGQMDLAAGEPGWDAPIFGPDAGRVLLFPHPVGSMGTIALPAPAGTMDETLGWSLAAGDVNGNGFHDLLAGAPHGFGAGMQTRRAVLFQHTGALVTTQVILDPSALPRSFGHSVAIGDVDGALPLEILVGDPAYNQPMPFTIAAGRAFLMSANGALLQVLDSPSPAFAGNFGQSVAVADLTGDGLGDLLVGELGQNRAHILAAPGFAVAETLLTVRAGDVHGGRSVAVGDLDGNGSADAVLGSSSCNGGGLCGSVSCFLGPSRAARGYLTSAGVASVGGFAWSLAVADLDGNGQGDVAVGAPASNPGFVPGAGQVLVMR